LRPDIWTAFRERFGIARIIEMYGATEGNVALHNADGRVGAVGKPHPLLEDTVRLARFDLARGALVRGPDGFCIACAPGEAGELLGKVGGAMEYDGYTDRAASERKLVRDAFARGDAWFRTGDLLLQDADGYYYFVDRIGDTFRWKGENVATQEVADVLCGAPAATEADVDGWARPGPGAPPPRAARPCPPCRSASRAARPRAGARGGAGPCSSRAGRGSGREALPRRRPTSPPRRRRHSRRAPDRERRPRAPRRPPDARAAPPRPRPPPR